ncbi:substrate-binding domain-containing protein [Achromobacter insuavis]
MRLVLPPRFPGAPAHVALAELMRFPLVMQDEASAAGRLVLQWLRSEAAAPQNAVYANSFAALGGMTVAGLGIGCLPYAVARELVERGLVREIKTTPKTPRMRYVTIMRSGQGTPFLARVARLAADVCDYNLRYQEAGEAPCSR